MSANKNAHTSHIHPTIRSVVYSIEKLCSLSGPVIIHLYIYLPQPTFFVPKRNILTTQHPSLKFEWHKLPRYTYDAETLLHFHISCASFNDLITAPRLKPEASSDTSPTDQERRIKKHTSPGSARATPIKEAAKAIFKKTQTIPWVAK